MKRYGSIDEALDVNDDLLTTDEEQLLLTIIKEKGVECKDVLGNISAAPYGK